MSFGSAVACLALLLLSCCAFPDISSAPWHQQSSQLVEESGFRDSPHTIFSPSGKIYAVEAAVEATNKVDNPTSNLVIALECKDGIVMVSTIPLSLYLNASLAAGLCHLDQLPSPILNIDERTIGATAGNAVDRRQMRFKLEALMEDALKNDVPVDYVARRLADHLQTGTQNSVMHASSTVLVGGDTIWRIDPTGQFWACHAAVIGRGADQAQAKLYELIQEQGEGNADIESCLKSKDTREAIELACECIESTLRSKRRAPTQPGDPPIFWHAVAFVGGEKRELRGMIWEQREETIGEVAQ